VELISGKFRFSVNIRNENTCSFVFSCEKHHLLRVAFNDESSHGRGMPPPGRGGFMGGPPGGVDFNTGRGKN